MRILSIDYGEKRMGFAVGNSAIKNVFPLNPWQRKKPEHDIEHIKKILSEFEIDKIIIGYPLNMNGSESPMSKKVEAFRKFLKKHTRTDIELVDERLTSFEAEEMLKPIVIGFEKRKKMLDSAAAWIILKNYLEDK
jgi:putative Holliday junction resolvase